jgi:hypothetical protein
LESLFITQLDQCASQPSYIFQIPLKPLPARLCSYTDYTPLHGTIRDSWLQDFGFEQHNCWFSSSPNGWTSDELGLKWLESLLQKESRDSARRNWRMLFVDGHSSHVTTSFLKAAMDLEILVVIYPPHSTHRLQPLDVGCFAPLATCYSQNLEAFTSSSEGLTRMGKREFLRIF